jgi:hypothetical protein
MEVTAYDEVTQTVRFALRIPVRVSAPYGGVHYTVSIAQQACN